jgi:hypothetical protein
MKRTQCPLERDSLGRRQQHGQWVYLQAVDDRTGQSMTDARRSADKSEDEALSTSVGNQFSWQQPVQPRSAIGSNSGSRTFVPPPIVINPHISQPILCIRCIWHSLLKLNPGGRVCGAWPATYGWPFGVEVNLHCSSLYKKNRGGSCLRDETLRMSC